MTQYLVGSDIGGTFTDVVVVDEHGRTWLDKADTTPAALGDGLLAALDNVAGQMRLPLNELLGRTRRFVNGTTVVTNAVAELSGARVGLITTAGFGDSLLIARSARNAHRDHHRQVNLPQIVPRERVAELRERVDSRGEVVVDLTRDEVRRAIEVLVAQGVEAIAVSLLWSFNNPTHEELVASVLEEYPELFVSLSHRLHPVIREYERTMTTVLNSYTCLRVAQYVESIESRLIERGLAVPVSFMQGFGGTVSAEEARERPVTLVDSGPAAGVVGGQALGRRLGLPDLVTADMGGTSFDVSVLPEGRTSVTRRVMLRDQFLTALSKVDVLPIGTGGGSIARLDARGMPVVGPRSAGAVPGPACYGRGGQEPTVTDAAAVLGLLDPGEFLGGRRTLDLDASREALVTGFGAGLGLDADAAADAVHRVVTADMAEAVRAVTVERGHDPRSFALCAYGGALGLFACDIARETGISTVVIPREAAVFSAHGLLDCDDVRTRVRSVSWTGGPADEVRETLLALESEAMSALEATGARETEVSWQLDLKFSGQQWDLTVDVARDPDLGQDALEQIVTDFPARYEAEFGAGSAWTGSPVLVMAARVTAQANADRPAPWRPEPDGREDGAARRGTRSVRLPGRTQREEVAVFDATALAPGAEVSGPAVLEHPLTTVFVAPGWTHRVDPFGNHLLSAPQAEARENTPSAPEIAEVPA